MAKASCDSCEKVLKANETIRVVSVAYVTENTQDSFDYERESDEAVLCENCDYKTVKGKR